MRFIEIEALPNGAHRNQCGGLVEEEGWAIIPDEMEVPNTFPFVNITVEDGIVTSMEAGIVPEPQPYVPQPTVLEQLRADVDFIMAMEGYIE